MMRAMVSFTSPPSHRTTMSVGVKCFLASQESRFSRLPFPTENFYCHTSRKNNLPSLLHNKRPEMPAFGLTQKQLLTTHPQVFFFLWDLNNGSFLSSFCEPPFLFLRSKSDYTEGNHPAGNG